MATQSEAAQEKGSAAATAQAQKSASSPRGRPSLLLIGSGVALFVVLALGLGLGLGLGLKHDHSSGGSSSASSSSSSSAMSTAATATATSLPQSKPTPLPDENNGTSHLESWRRDTSKEYLLDMSWDLHAPPTTRYYNLTVSEGVGWPDGVVRSMLFINGKFPGPLIELNRGDTIVVNVTNHMSNATSMHWHGMYQNTTNWFDGTTGITQCPIPPGQSLLYNFTVNNQYGTYWYHSHFSTQYTDGLVGPFIVHAPEEEEQRKLYDREQVLMLQDWYHLFSTVNLKNYLSPNEQNIEPVPDNGLVNGFGYFNCSLYSASSGFTCYQNSTYPVLEMEPNTKTRFRMINSGAFTEFEASVDNHTLTLLEADGTIVKPHDVQRIAIHVAQRYSFIMDADQSTETNYWFRGNMIAACFGASNPVLDLATKAVISYSGNATTAPTNKSQDWSSVVPEECVDLQESDLIPSIYDPPPPADTVFQASFSFNTGPSLVDIAIINGTSWTAMQNQSTLIQAVNGLSSGNVSAWSVQGAIPAFENNQFVVGVGKGGYEVVDVLLYSEDDGAHPFHLHGHKFWILETGSGPFSWDDYNDNLKPGGPRVNNAIKRDTLVVEAYAWALVRFVADNPGLWAFHCHIAWHLAAGLMMQVMSRPDVLATTVIPDDVLALCKANQPES